MLVLSRKEREAIHVGDDIVVHVCRIEGSRVKLAIDAPIDVKIMRSDLPRHQVDALTILPDGMPTNCELAELDCTE